MEFLSDDAPNAPIVTEHLASSLLNSFVFKISPFVICRF